MKMFSNQVKMKIVTVAIFLSTLLLGQSGQAQFSNQVFMEQNQNVSTITKPGFTVNITADPGDENFRLVINNPSQLKLKIFVGSSTEEVYTDATNNKNYHRRFSLKNAEDGEYIIKIKFKKQIIEKRVVINTYTQVSRKIDIN